MVGAETRSLSISERSVHAAGSEANIIFGRRRDPPMSVRQYRDKRSMMRTDSVTTAAGSANRTSSRVGLVARSPEGHAAKTMQIKGHEDQWVDIQAHTFRNWVNEHVRPPTARVQDLAADLKDGRVLCELVEDLQNKKILPAWSRSPPGNRHQMLENVSKALAAIADDGVKLVNIGELYPCIAIRVAHYCIISYAPPTASLREKKKRIIRKKKKRNLIIFLY